MPIAQWGKANVRHAAPGVHCVARRRACVATSGARAAAAGDWIPALRLTRAERQTRGWIAQRLGGRRLCGGEERRDRISLGRREGRQIARIGVGPGASACCGHRHRSPAPRQRSQPKLRPRRFRFIFWSPTRRTNWGSCAASIDPAATPPESPPWPSRWLLSGSAFCVSSCRKPSALHCFSSQAIPARNQ
jgi:hypothetical protein